MKFVIITLLLLFSFTGHAQPEEVVTLPKDHPVDSLLFFPVASERYFGYIKNRLFKNLDNLLIGDSIFIKQNLIGYGGYGDYGEIRRKYYKVSFSKKNGIADGLFQIEYLYETQSRYTRWKENTEEVVRDSVPITIVTGNYKDGVKQGLWTFYNFDGKLFAQGELQGNKQVGKWFERRQELFFNIAKLKTSKVYFLESNYTQDGLLNGKSVGYQSMNKKVKMIEIDYANGVKNGLQIMYYPNGKLHVKAEYKQGKRNGLYQAWAEDGTKKLEMAFKDSLLHGQFRTWWSNLQIATTGQYVEERKIGLWESFDKNGTLVSHGLYENGRKNGRWTVHFLKQKVSRVEFIKEGEVYETHVYTDTGCLIQKETRNNRNRKVKEEFECQ